MDGVLGSVRDIGAYLLQELLGSGSMVVSTEDEAGIFASGTMGRLDRQELELIDRVIKKEVREHQETICLDSFNQDIDLYRDLPQVLAGSPSNSRSDTRLGYTLAQILALLAETKKGGTPSN